MSTPDGVIAIDVVPGTVLSDADSSAFEIDASAVRLKKVATDGSKGSSRSVRFAELPPASAPSAADEIPMAEETPATYVPSPATPPAAAPPAAAPDPHLNQLTSHLKKRRLSSYEARREASHHAHHSAGPSIVSQILSGLINGLIYFVFCCVFSQTIFGQNAVLKKAVALGVGQQTLSVLVGGVIFTIFSGFRAVFAGPDLLPAIFLREAARVVSVELCPNGFDDYGAVGECAHEKDIVPTALAAIWVATLMVGVVYALLGKLRLAGAVVGYIPANVVAGFMSCIGWKVVKAAIEVASGRKFKFESKYLGYIFGGWEQSWMLLIPALGIGVTLYVLKRKHWGSPTVYFPLLILIPAAVFYAAVYGSGLTLSDARALGWLNTEQEQINFWDQWVKLYEPAVASMQPDAANYNATEACAAAAAAAVDRRMLADAVAALPDANATDLGDACTAPPIVVWSALGACVPTFLLMALILSLDNLLKLASTESALGLDLVFNYEMMIGGGATLLVGLLAGAPAYGQTKFNVLNYGITHSTERRFPSVINAAFCGLLFFLGFPVLNVIPRFILAALLVFAGAGFLIENLIDAYARYSKMSFLGIWLIFMINMFGELWQALLAGVVWAAVAFAIHFAAKSDLRPIICGEEHSSSAVRSAAQEMKLGVLGTWYAILRVDGFIFFGTATRVVKLFKQHLERELEEKQRCERCKMLIVDMSGVSAIDPTANAAFAKVRTLAKRRGIELVWAGMNKSVRRRLGQWKILDGAKDFRTLDDAEKFVEDELLEHVHVLAQRWLFDAAARSIYNHTMLHDAITANTSVSDGLLGPSHLLQWAEKVVVSKGDEIVSDKEDETVEGIDDALYLLFRGRVEDTDGSTVYPGAFFNTECLYMPPGAGEPVPAVAVEDSVLLRLSHKQREEMLFHEPHVAHQLLLAVLKQREMRHPSRRHPHHYAPRSIREDPFNDGPGIPLLKKAETALENGKKTLSPFLKSSPQPALTPTERDLLGVEPSIDSAPRSPRPSASDNVEEGSTVPPLPELSTSTSTSVGGKRRGSAGTLAGGAPSPPKVNRGSSTLNSARGEVRRQHDAKMLTRDNTRMGILRQAQAAAAEKTPPRDGFTTPPHGGAHDHHHGHHGDHHESIMHKLNVALHQVSHKLDEASDRVRDSIWRDSVDHHDSDNEQEDELRHRASHRAHSTAHSPAESRPLSRSSSFQRHGSSSFADALHSDGTGRLHAHSGHRERAVSHHKLSIVDAEFLSKSDHKVPLTSSQRQHYSVVFHLNDHDHSGHLKIKELSLYMESLGHGVSVTELEQMMHDVGITEDQDGTITEDDFLEFARRTLVADLPASRVPLINTLFERAAGRSKAEEESLEASHPDWKYEFRGSAASENGMMVHKPQAAEALRELGFDLDEETFDEVFAEIDGDGDGSITNEEFINGIGMLKREVLEIMQLEASFTRLRANARRSATGGDIEAANGGPPKDEHMIYASDLVAILGVTELEAEEMIFIADLKENSAIDFTEFRQVVVNWS